MMSASLADLLGPLVNVIAIVITCSSTYFLWTRRTSKFNQVRHLLIVVYLISVALISVEFFRIAEPSSFVPTYATLSLVISLSEAVILMVAATAIYLDAPDTSFRAMLSAVAASRRNLAAILAYAIYTAFLLIILVALKPLTTVEMTDVWGAADALPVYSNWYIALLLPELLVFLFYGTFLVARTASRTTDSHLRNSLRAVAASWGAVAAIYLTSGAIADVVAIDATSLMYLAFSIMFAYSALSFNRASLLAGLLLKSTGEPPLRPPSRNGKTSIPSDLLHGRRFLVEFDPTVQYERVVLDAVTQARANGSGVFVFTSRSSSVYSALSKVPGLKYFLLSSNVNYVRPSDRPDEVLLPQDNTSILLEVISKAVSENKGQRTTIVFDSVTDMLVMLGLDETYRFLRRVNEILADSGAGAIFLLTPGAHDQRADSTIRSLFAYHMVVGPGGVKIAKGEVPLGPEG